MIFLLLFLQLPLQRRHNINVIWITELVSHNSLELMWVLSRCESWISFLTISFSRCCVPVSTPNWIICKYLLSWPETCSRVVYTQTQVLNGTCAFLVGSGFLIVAADKLLCTNLRNCQHLMTPTISHALIVLAGERGLQSRGRQVSKCNRRSLASLVMILIAACVCQETQNTGGTWLVLLQVWESTCAFYKMHCICWGKWRAFHHTSG